MKALMLTPFAFLALFSCEAGPQRQAQRDSTKKAGSPATKFLDPDSPADTRMPVILTDTSQQADMPVVRPPKNIQPK